MPPTSDNPADSEISAPSFQRPRLVLSKCLELAACRHDGQRINNSFVAQLLDFVDIVPVCPEVEIGLGTPRDAIRLVNEDGTTRLIQPKTGRDLTEQMHGFAEKFLASLGPLDGFVLKSGSPTCGSANVSVYAKAERSPGVRREPGLFAGHVLDQFDHLAIEDEGRLRNFYIRHHFLTRLYTLADLRHLGEKPSMSALVDFQRRHKHLMLLYDEPGMRRLGRIVANHDGLTTQEVYEKYAEQFRRSIQEEPERKTHINVLMHIYGHFKKKIGDRERHEFLEILDELQHQHLTLHAPLAVIRTWCARFDYDYMADQSYLEPYPHKLFSMRDSGKGFDT